MLNPHVSLSAKPAQVPTFKGTVKEKVNTLEGYSLTGMVNKTTKEDDLTLLTMFKQPLEADIPNTKIKLPSSYGNAVLIGQGIVTLIIDKINETVIKFLLPPSQEGEKNPSIFTIKVGEGKDLSQEEAQPFLNAVIKTYNNPAVKSTSEEQANSVVMQAFGTNRNLRLKEIED